jgi:hypothetical protein
MVKALSVIVFFFSVLRSEAQSDSVTNDILTTGKFRKGIFRNYEAFRHNTPTIETGFKIVADTGKYDRYYLYFEKGRKIREVYGFSDGNDLFVNAQIYCDLNYYVRVQLLGPISYFEDKLGKRNAVSSHGRLTRAVFVGVGGVAGAVIGNLATRTKPIDNSGWVVSLGDSDGQAYLFDQKTLLSIFKESNRPLYDRLKVEKDRNNLELLMNYVNEFNEHFEK